MQESTRAHCERGQGCREEGAERSKLARSRMTAAAGTGLSSTGMRRCRLEHNCDRCSARAGWGKANADHWGREQLQSQMKDTYIFHL